MSYIAQLIVVALALLAAAGYVGWRVWRKLRGESHAGCGAGCGSCSQQAAEPKAVVSLESLTSSLDRLPSSQD